MKVYTKLTLEDINGIYSGTIDAFDSLNSLSFPLKSTPLSVRGSWVWYKTKKGALDNMAGTILVSADIPSKYLEKKDEWFRGGPFFTTKGLPDSLDLSIEDED